MTEREKSPEGQIISIAHGLIQEGIVPKNPVYKGFMKNMKPNGLHGLTIEEALKTGHRQEVYEFVRFLTSEPFI